MHYRAFRKLEDGRELDRVSPAIFPNVRSTPDVHLRQSLNTRMCWVVPIDDTHHCQFNAIRVRKGADFRMNRPNYAGGAGRKWLEMSEEEHQMYPGDWEAQLGQGAITFHSEEHLAGSDKGVVMLRRLLREQIDVVRKGGDPIGVSFDPKDEVCTVGAGNFFREPA
jgi:hypothetical protein